MNTDTRVTPTTGARLGKPAKVIEPASRVQFDDPALAKAYYRDSTLKVLGEPAPPPPPPTPAPEPTPPPAGHAYATQELPFAADSWINAPFADASSAHAGDVNDPRTTAFRALGSGINGGNGHLDWAIIPFFAKAGDPERFIGADDNKKGTTVRIPANAQAGAKDDAHLAIVDGMMLVEAWGAAQRSDGSWWAKSMETTSLAGSGMHGGMRAANVSILAGLGRAWEFDGRTDEIQHGWAMAFPQRVQKAHPVWPAEQIDTNHGGYAGPIDIGTRFWLPQVPDGLTVHQARFARSLNRIGAFDVDSGGSGAAILSFEPACHGPAFDEVVAIWPKLIKLMVVAV